MIRFSCLVIGSKKKTNFPKTSVEQRLKSTVFRLSLKTLPISSAILKLGIILEIGEDKKEIS